MSYFKYLSRDAVSSILIATAWMSLTTFVLVAKNSIGIPNIPMFEIMAMLAGIIGTQIAHYKYNTIPISKLIDVIVESVFLVGILYQLYAGTIENAGVMVYMIIIAHQLYKDGLVESKRVYEDKYIKHANGKNMLKIFRKRITLYMSIGGTVGSGIGLIALSYYKMDLILFTKIMLMVNLAANIYDYYVYVRYARKLKKV